MSVQMLTWVALGVSIFGWLLALGFVADSNADMRVLREFNLGNGRLRLVKQDRREAVFRLGYLSLLVAKSALLVHIMSTTVARPPRPPVTAVIVLFVASVVVVTVDGWLARRERHALRRTPSVGQVAALLEDDDRE